MVGILSYLNTCASIEQNNEYSPQVEGSQHLEPSAKESRNPRIFFGVSFF